jgi:hypothetical protein
MCKLLLLISLILPQLYDYYPKNRLPNGLVLDRESNRDLVSIAATGFGLYASALECENKSPRREEAIAEFNRTLDTIKRITPAFNRGWLYHFMDASGNPTPGTEVSTIDSALFWLSAQRGATLLRDQSLIDRVNREISLIDVDFMLSPRGFFYHGFYQCGTTIQCEWDELSEGVLLYKLFNVDFKPLKVKYNLPLFVYYYPLAFYEDEDTMGHLRKAIDWQLVHYQYFGISACDSDEGYVDFNENVVSPLAILSTLRYDERAQLEYQKYSLFGSTNLKTGWRSTDRIGIDWLMTFILLKKER